MGHFTYFIPGVSGVNQGILAAAGLLDRFMGASGRMRVHSAGHGEGPKGSGCFIAPGENVEYSPETQRWTEGAKFWVGVDTATMPMPEDLARELIVTGQDLTLADNKVWHVPTLHKWDMQRMGHTPNLPQIMRNVVVGGRVQCIMTVRPEFMAAHALAAEIFESFVAERAIPGARLVEMACAILNVNYRVGVEETGLLGLLDEATALSILRVAIDAEEIEIDARRWILNGLKPPPERTE